MSNTGPAGPEAPWGDAQDEVIRFLSSPEAYADHPDRVERCETHGAIVFLAGDRAYKMKRSVRFSYMDFSTLPQRQAAILRELNLNKPHAPELYLDVTPVTRAPNGRLAIGGPGLPLEWLLIMRRFDQSDVLSDRATLGPLDPGMLKLLADAVHAFHRSEPAVRNADTVRQLGSVIDDVRDALLRPLRASLSETAATFHAEAKGQLAALSDLLARRARSGFVRRCHGDLHLGNVVLWKGRPTLFDALEFDERLATIDTLYDLAFLIMDLAHRGDATGANIVLNRYLWRSDAELDLEGLAALPLFLSVRAGVRAMVAADRAAQVTGAESGAKLDEAGRYMASAIGHLGPRSPRLIAVGGLSGSGKSTLAAALAPKLDRPPGALHLRSDLERKSMLGVGELDRLPPEAYGAGTSEKVYARLCRKARVALAGHQTVVTDAVYALETERSAIEAVATELDVPFCGLWLEAPRHMLAARVEARRNDASDATREVVERQSGYDTGRMMWCPIDSTGTPAGTLAAVEAALNRLFVKGDAK